MKFLALVLTLLICGCVERQSALSPHGEGAHQIAQLSWMLVAICTAVFALVLLATWFAIRGNTRIRDQLSDPRIVVWAGVVFPVTVLTFLLFYSAMLMRAVAIGASVKPDLRVHVSGEQWWWRIQYEVPGGTRVESANEIRIPVGAEVELVLTSPDVIHSLWVPSLGGKVDMIPGRINRMRARAERPGIFRGQCAEYCGGPHALMSLSVIALLREEFDGWMKAERAAALTPETQDAVRGQKLFSASGCGGCHVVRGTDAAGRIGPDLTHYGSRRSIGAELLPLTAENTARFIEAGQTLKPGNRMPQFRIFSKDELNSVASYLLELK